MDEFTPGAVPEIWTQQSFDFPDDFVTEFGIGIPQEMVPAIADAVLDTLVHLDIDPESVYLSGHDGLEPDPDSAKLRARAELDDADLSNAVAEFLEPDSVGADYDTEKVHDADLPETYDTELLDPRQAPPGTEFGEHEHDLERPELAEDADVSQQVAREAGEEVFLRHVGRPNKPAYYMSDVTTLYDRAEDYTNPIHFAGAETTSTIVVYDKGLINTLDAEATAAEATELRERSIITTEAELAVTVLARIRLRYRIPGEPDLAPPPIPNN